MPRGSMWTSRSSYACVSTCVEKSLRLAALGVVAGTLGALGLSKLISSLLYGIGPTDPVTYGLVILVLALTTALAAYLPALRASRTDPARVLGSA